MTNDEFGISIPNSSFFCEFKDFKDFKELKDN